MAIELRPGTVIGARYRLERLLGEGGMGTVWAAEDLELGQRCALKLMKEAAGDPEARKRFLREGRAAAAVRHPNVVGILDVLELDGESPVIVMELLDGEPLRAMLRRAQQLPLPELAEIIVPVVSAVGAAHALGIVHRDLKPENIFLARGPDGERVVKVLDFGIAKLTALDGEAMRSTGITTGAVLGTPAYMAPEQVFAEKDLDHRADVWALGIILYECLAGVCPTQGDNAGQILKHVVSKPFEPLGQRVPGLPQEISVLVARMLERERSDRPADLHEVLEVLAPFASAPAKPFGRPAPRPTSADELATTQSPSSRLAELVGNVDPRDKPVSPRSRGSQLRPLLGSAAGLVALGAIVVKTCWPGSTPAPTPSPSPLDPPEAKLACPILTVSGIEAPNGWLGAAAAATACERARVILGGRPERTLVPAELLGLPGTPTDHFEQDPYGQPGARGLTLTAARQRAQAYLDGEVTWSPAGFTVVLSLHRADGSELKRSPGEGRVLYEAVRSAMVPLVGPGLIPQAATLDPGVAAWSRTDSIGDALGVLDLTFASVQNDTGLPGECSRFAALSARVRELGPEGRWLCAVTLGRPEPPVDLDPSEADSDAGRATRIRVNLLVHQTATRSDVQFLRQLFPREKTPRGQALIAATESCLRSAGSSADPDQVREARERALLAVKTEPKTVEGGGCNPWEQLMTVERYTMLSDSVTRAMQAWVPWSSYAWLEPAFSSGGRDPAAVSLLRRAHVLSPLDTQIADMLVIGLLSSGDRAAARVVATDLSRGTLPLHRVEIELIDLRIKASEAHFGAALDQARKRSEISSTDAGWIRSQRFEFGWLAFELAVLLGQDREVADELVKRFLDPEPTPLDANSPVVPVRIPAICARASAPDRCFARLRELRPQLSAASTKDTDDFVAGAERYVKGDLSEAARAWRPLLGGRGMVATVMPDAMADAFEPGDPDLAEQVDQEVMKRRGELNGATLGHVRAALRAFKRSDRAKAKELASQVVEAWRVADEKPPALARMVRLLEQLERPGSPAPSP